jgi:CPA2 family monovalent cation:H+ antiporter-2
MAMYPYITGISKGFVRCPIDKHGLDGGGMDYSYLNDTLIILASTVAVVVLFLRIGLPPILGYLSVGAFIGPYGLALVFDVEHIRVLAEFGVVFLLFTIGLEFSVPLLIRMRGSVLGLGGTQVLLTVALTAAVAMYFGFSIETALVLGGVVAMSSTALVTKQLSDQVELHTRHGRNTVGILLLQDLMVVPLLILVTSLSGQTLPTSAMTILAAFGQGLLALLLIFAFGRWVLKPLFREVAGFRSAELFTLTVLLVVLCSAWATHKIGLSFALGAFLAGVMLSETEFRHQVESEIRPFRDVLLGLFFITVGMMLDIRMIPDIWHWVLLLLTVLMVAKMLLVMGLCRLAGWNSVVSMRTGLILAHGGEFGFAILILALDANLFSPDVAQIVLAALLFSIGLAPFILRYNGEIVSFIMPVATAMSQKRIRDQIVGTTRGLHNHVIICGFGRVGQNSMKLLNDEGIHCMAIDLDQERVKYAAASKQPVYYGDASSLELLNACGLSRASAVVVSTIDFNTTMKILRRVRSVDGELPVIVRARKEIHLYQLYQAEASDVVADTFDTSQMLTREMLSRFNLYS